MDMSQYPVISGTFCVLISRKDSGRKAPEDNFVQGWGQETEVWHYVPSSVIRILYRSTSPLAYSEGDPIVSVYIILFPFLPVL